MRILATLIVLLVSIGLKAQIKLPVIFDDHMVIQQQATVPIWGWAQPVTGYNYKNELGYYDHSNKIRQRNFLENHYQYSARPEGLIPLPSKPEMMFVHWRMLCRGKFGLRPGNLIWNGA